MSLPLSILLLVFSPILLGLALGLVQLLVYRLLCRSGWMTRERIPFFLILFLRGMVAVIAVGAIFAIIQTISNGKPM